MDNIKKAADAFLGRKLCGEKAPLVQTGIPALDSRIGGLPEGSFSVLSAETGKGKSSFALFLALQCARRTGAKVLYVSCELTEWQTTSRILSIETGITSARMLGDLSEEDLDVLMDAKDELPESLIIAHPTFADENTIEEYTRNEKPQLVIIDNLDCIVHGQDYNEAYRRVIRRLLTIARGTGVAILALGQIHRNLYGLKRTPTKADVMGTSNVENTASVMMTMQVEGAGRTAVARITFEKLKTLGSTPPPAYFHADMETGRFTAFSAEERGEGYA